MAAPTISWPTTFANLTAHVSTAWDNCFAAFNTWINAVCGAANGIATLGSDTRLTTTQRTSLRGWLAYNNALTTIMGGNIDWQSTVYQTEGDMTVPAGASKVRLLACVKVDRGPIEAKFTKNPFYVFEGAGKGWWQQDVIGTCQVVSSDRVVLETPVISATPGDHFYLHLDAGAITVDATGLDCWMAMEIIE